MDMPEEGHTMSDFRDHLEEHLQDPEFKADIEDQLRDA